MPLYDWRCSECGEVVTVQRSFKDYKVGPDAIEAKDHGCDSLTFKRILTIPSRIFVHESEDVYWK